MSKYIGTSLPHCISDIAEGYVKIEDISFVGNDSGTNDPEIVIKGYSSGFWYSLSAPQLESAAAVTRKLFASQKIKPPVQSRSPYRDVHACWIDAETRYPVDLIPKESASRMDIAKRSLANAIALSDDDNEVGLYRVGADKNGAFYKRILGLRPKGT